MLPFISVPPSLVLLHHRLQQIPQVADRLERVGVIDPQCPLASLESAETQKKRAEREAEADRQRAREGNREREGVCGLKKEV